MDTTQPSSSSKSWIKWVALGCGGLVVVAVVVIAAVFLIVKQATAGPEEVIHEFLAAAAAGDYDTAHDCFSAPLKEVQSLDEFTASAEANPMFFKVTDTTFNNRSIDNTGAELSGTATLEAGTVVPASFKLVRENDEWKLISYQIGSE